MKGGGEHRKMLSKNILIPVVAITIAGGAFFAGNVYAQTSSNKTLSQVIAQKFNLDQSQVQAAIDQYRQQQQATMQQKLQQRLNDRLTNLVTSGKITDTQKQDIITELTKLQSEYNPQSLKNLTPAQRKEKFQAEQNEIQTWAKSEGIDASYLRPDDMRRFGGAKASPTPTPTT